MRRSLVSAAGTAVLLASSLLVLPAQSAAPAKPVDGNHFAASGLQMVSQGCDDSRDHPSDPPKFILKQGPGTPPIGDFSSGWAEPGTAYGVGVTAHVADPTTLKTLGISLNAADGARGRVVATYDEPGDTGVWKGSADLGDDTTKGWHRVNAAQIVYSWSHVTDGTIDSIDSGTLQDFADRRGGDGNGAEVGFIFGCDGNPFYTDALTVGTESAGRTFDFGGFRGVAKLRTYPGIAKRIHVTYGVGFNLTGKLFQQTTGEAMSGRLTIQARRPGSSTWNAIASKKIAAGGSVKRTVVPPKSVTYRVFYPGTARYEVARSRLVTVVVSPYVGAAFSDASVTKSHAFTLHGRVLPKQRRTIQLQRYLDGKWRTVKKGSTRVDGNYGISAITTRVGKSYWRIRVPGGNGNAAGTSRWRQLTTMAPSSGGSTPPTQNDPPPPPQDDPPPPPPTH